MNKTRLELKVSEDDSGVGYLYLLTHPGAGIPGIVNKQTALTELIDDYKGPDVYLDFDKDGVLIGIEIIS